MQWPRKNITVYQNRSCGENGNLWGHRKVLPFFEPGKKKYTFRRLDNVLYIGYYARSGFICIKDSLQAINSVVSYIEL